MTRPTNPADDVPESVRAVLEESSDQQLRAVIEYAQRRLEPQPALSDAIEARDGEELVRVEDHDGYAVVVVERPDETGANRGPFAYWVQRQPGIDGESADEYRWHYLGLVHGDAGGD